MAYSDIEAAARLTAITDRTYFWSDGDDELLLGIVCNDMFSPAADSELVALSEAPALLALYRADGCEGLMRWVAARRAESTQGARP